MTENSGLDETTKRSLMESLFTNPFKKKKKPEGTFKDKVASRPPVKRKKESGQPSSSTGFAKGPVSTGTLPSIDDKH